MPVIPLLPHSKRFSTLSNFSRSLGLQLTKNILETLTCTTTTKWPPTETCARVCLRPGHGCAVLQSASTCTGSQQQWSWAQALLLFFEPPGCYVHTVSTVQGCTSSHGHVQCSPSFWSFLLVWITEVAASKQGQATDRNLWRKIFKSCVFCQEGTTFMLKVLVQQFQSHW